MDTPLMVAFTGDALAQQPINFPEQERKNLRFVRREIEEHARPQDRSPLARARGRDRQGYVVTVAAQHVTSIEDLA